MSIFIFLTKVAVVDCIGLSLMLAFDRIRVVDDGVYIVSVKRFIPRLKSSKKIKLVIPG